MSNSGQVQLHVYDMAVNMHMLQAGTPAKAGASPVKGQRLLALTCVRAPIGSNSSGGSSRQLFIPALDAWDGLTVEYSPAWPLPLLMTPQVHLCAASRVLCGAGSCHVLTHTVVDRQSAAVIALSKGCQNTSHDICVCSCHYADC